MTRTPMDPKSLLRAAAAQLEAGEALLEAAKALHLLVEQPTQPPEPPPKPPTGKWIVGPLPTEADANFENDVKVPNVLDPTCPYEWAKYYVVQPGAPWCSPDDNPGPWDPTTLDRNGWIRSRLPTVGDASHTVGDASYVGMGSWVITPIKPGRDLFSFQHYTLVVPGQPWAPCGSEPGPYQP